MNGFYLGIYLPELNQGIKPVQLRTIERSLQTRFRTLSLYQAWGPESLEQFPETLLREVCQQGAVPLITWEPWTSTFPQYANDARLGQNRKVFAAILSGRFDSYLEAYAAKLQSLGNTVMVRFAHEADNPRYPWSRTGGNTPNEYVEAWRYVVGLFEGFGTTNVRWVWTPWSVSSIEKYFPGADYVDWIGLTALNYGHASRRGRWRQFEAIYRPLRVKLAAYGIPVMLAEFGSTTYGGDQTDWYKNAFSSIRDKYPEIRSIIFFHSDQDGTWPTSWRPDGETVAIDWTFADSADTVHAIQQALQQAPFNEWVQEEYPRGMSD